VYNSVNITIITSIYVPHKKKITYERRGGGRHGILICNDAPMMSHLLFVDDCFWFFRVIEHEAQVMKNILTTYEVASG